MKVDMGQTTGASGRISPEVKRKCISLVHREGYSFGASPLGHRKVKRKADMGVPSGAFLWGQGKANLTAK
jgi:hypothetical protein